MNCTSMRAQFHAIEALTQDQRIVAIALQEVRLCHAGQREYELRLAELVVHAAVDIGHSCIHLVNVYGHTKSWMDPTTRARN